MVSKTEAKELLKELLEEDSKSLKEEKIKNFVLKLNKILIPEIDIVEESLIKEQKKEEKRVELEQMISKKINGYLFSLFEDNYELERFSYLINKDNDEAIDAKILLEGIVLNDYLKKGVSSVISFVDGIAKNRNAETWIDFKLTQNYSFEYKRNMYDKEKAKSLLLKLWKEKETNINLETVYELLKMFDIAAKNVEFDKIDTQKMLEDILSEDFIEKKIEEEMCNYKIDHTLNYYLEDVVDYFITKTKDKENCYELTISFGNYSEFNNFSEKGSNFLQELSNKYQCDLHVDFILYYKS